MAIHEDAVDRHRHAPCSSAQMLQIRIDTAQLMGYRQQCVPERLVIRGHLPMIIDLPTHGANLMLGTGPGERRRQGQVRRPSRPRPRARPAFRRRTALPASHARRRDDTSRDGHHWRRADDRGHPHCQRSCLVSEPRLGLLTHAPPRPCQSPSPTPTLLTVAREELSEPGLFMNLRVERKVGGLRALSQPPRAGARAIRGGFRGGTAVFQVRKE